MRGGEGLLEIFRKFIRFGSVTLPLVLDVNADICTLIDSPNLPFPGMSVPQNRMNGSLTNDPLL